MDLASERNGVRFVMAFTQSFDIEYLAMKVELQHLWRLRNKMIDTQFTGTATNSLDDLRLGAKILDRNLWEIRNNCCPVVKLFEIP